MLAARLRQLRFSLRGRPVTLAYPFAPHPPEPGARGRVTVATDRCIGCAGCADVCPARCILVTDLSPALRVLRRHLERCLHCGRCAAVCGHGAVRLSGECELSTPDRADLLIEQRLFMGTCERCGRCFAPAHPLDRTRPGGWRRDEPALRAGAAEDAWKA